MFLICIEEAVRIGPVEVFLTLLTDEAGDVDRLCQRSIRPGHPAFGKGCFDHGKLRIILLHAFSVFCGHCRVYHIGADDLCGTATCHPAEQTVHGNHGEQDNEQHNADHITEELPPVFISGKDRKNLLCDLCHYCTYCDTHLLSYKIFCFSEY